MTIGDTATFLEAPNYIQELIALTRRDSYDEEPDYGQFREVLKSVYFSEQMFSHL